MGRCKSSDGTMMTSAHRPQHQPQPPPRPPPRGESHRIYWQQWIANNNNTTAAGSNGSSNSSELQMSLSRELITSSAAVRLTVSATTADVTQLLRQTMELNENDDDDAIVLVGTLYSTSDRLVQFDIGRFLQPPQSSSSLSLSSSAHHNNEALLSSSEQPLLLLPRTKPFHVVQTLRGEARPLEAREEMLQYLEALLERDNSINNNTTVDGTSSSSSNTATTSSTTTTAVVMMTPKLQFYYIPSPRLEAMPVLIPNCVELDGYATDMDDENDDDDEEQEQMDAGLDKNDDVDDDEAEHEFRPIEEMFPWLVAPNDDDVDNDACHTPKKVPPTTTTTTTNRTNRAYHHHGAAARARILAEELQRLPKSHSGYILQCDRHDPYVWRTVWCAVTADHLWTVSRLRRRSKNGGSIHHYYHPHIQRIPLSRALLLQPSADYPPLFKTPYAWEIVIVADGGGDNNNNNNNSTTTTTTTTTHLFRANHRAAQIGWIEAISVAIVSAYETSLLVQAESLMVEKCVARSRRYAHLAVAPLMMANAAAVARDDGRPPMPSPQQPTMMQHNVLIFGHAVADYHEQCQLGLATWGLVWSLRQQVAVLVEWHHHGQQQQKKKNNMNDHRRSSSRLYTLRNHLDFCLTGRQRSSSNGNSNSGSGLSLYLGEPVPPPANVENITLHHHHYPEGIPPHDLFDGILAELQHLITCSPW